jgi:hypothetical protein
LDVLQAQKDDTDVHLNYIAALAERASALIALEQVANFWDISFPPGQPISNLQPAIVR